MAELKPLQLEIKIGKELKEAFESVNVMFIKTAEEVAKLKERIEVLENGKP